MATIENVGGDMLCSTFAQTTGLVVSL